MENASKALIIAGAILIAILLISLGILVFKASSGTTDQAKNTTKAMEQGAQTGVNSIQNALNLNIGSGASY